jgi:hypothetical protein
MLLSSIKTAESLAGLTVSISNGECEATTCQSESLEQIRQQNPIALSLPLLETIARQEQASIQIPYLNTQCITVEL